MSGRDLITPVKSWRVIYKHNDTVHCPSLQIHPAGFQKLHKFLQWSRGEEKSYFHFLLIHRHLSPPALLSFPLCTTWLHILLIRLCSMQRSDTHTLILTPLPFPVHYLLLLSALHSHKSALNTSCSPHTNCVHDTLSIPAYCQLFCSRIHSLQSLNIVFFLSASRLVKY